MNKKSLYLLGLSALLSLFSACEDHRDDFMVEDKVYISKSGILEEGAYALGTGETKLELWAVKSGVNGSSGQVTFTVDPQLLEDYNRNQSTPLELLPQDCYRIPQTVFSLSEDQPTAPFELFYDLDKIAGQYGYGRKYLLPIRLKSEGIPVNTAKDHVLLILNAMDPSIGFREFGSKTFDVKRTDENYREQLTIGVDFKNTIDVTVQVRAGNRDLVNAYNQENGTNYQALPENCFSLSSATPVLLQNETDVSVECVIKSQNIPGGKYLLPVELVSASPYNVANGNRVYYYIFNNVSEWWTSEIDKKDWKILNVSSFHSDGSQSPAKIIDGNTADGYWTINYAKKNQFEHVNGVYQIPADRPQWIIVDLGKEMNIGGLKWYPRPRKNVAMSIEFYVAQQEPDASLLSGEWLNKGSYTYEGTYDINESIWHKVASAEDFGGSPKELHFEDQAQTGRYLQIRIVKGPDSSCMGEIDVLEMKK